MPETIDSAPASAEVDEATEKGLWSKTPSSLKWLFGIVAGWILTDVVLNSLLGLIPPPWELLKIILRHAWTPWTLAGVLFGVTILLFLALRMSGEVMEEIKSEVGKTLHAADGALDAQEETIDTLEAMLQVSLKTVRLQSDVLWSLDNLLADDVPLACKNMVKMILAENAHLLSDLIFRCYVLRPSGDYLTTYIAQQLPEPDGYERKFYIGDEYPQMRRGLAGFVYKNNSIEIARRVETDDPSDGVKFDHPEFIPLDSTVSVPQYRSVICIPVRPERDRCIGVLCLDSEDTDAFDDPMQQQYLSGLGILLGFILDLSSIAEREDQKPRQLLHRNVEPTVQAEPDRGGMA